MLTLPPLATILLAALLLSPALRRRIGPGRTFAAICFILPLATTYAAILATGHNR
ncbi:hypothetical protein [Streptacidiphilus carbonis]|uniref:hypothetical protein n=1 Tax=Streptacidiphilus carbonis TaxID=105422 RepID=UPI000AFB5C2E|nr:hypothetical protein [Streptacidiphilus carbonis]